MLPRKKRAAGRVGRMRRFEKAGFIGVCILQILHKMRANFAAQGRKLGRCI